MELKILLVVALVAAEGLATPLGANSLSKASTCYENLGCFTTEYPWTSDARPQPVLPETPSIVGTKLKLMKLLGDGVTVDYYILQADDDFNFDNSDFDLTKKLAVTIHDWTHSSDALWVSKASKSLLLQGDKNVMAVDWKNGAGYPYLRAVGNSQLVGAELARMLTYLAGKGISVSDVHIIGHGLGAQVAAYTATRLPGIGRITGLDPARLYFEGTDPLVRLDESDARFVDIIHTDRPRSGHVSLGFDTNTGHVDFYPNNAVQQPGCSDELDKYVDNDDELLSATLSGTIENFACSHLRVTDYFVDSMEPSYNCIYQAVPCVSWSAFQSGNCYQGCTSGKCSNMGYYANLETGNGTLYLSTYDTAPYCVRTVRLQTDVTLSQEKTEGSVKAIVVGNSGQTQEFQLIDSEILAGFILSTTIQTRGAGPFALGDIVGLQLRYDEACCFGLGSTNTLEISRAFTLATTTSAIGVITEFNGAVLEDGKWLSLVPADVQEG